MNEVISRYILAFDEINVLAETSYQTSDGENLFQKVNQIADDLLSFLINAYVLGIQSASKQLDSELTADIDEMYDAIYLIIDGKTFEDRVADHVLGNGVTGLKTLAESEFHRVYNTAVIDGAKVFVAKEGIGVTKIWLTVNDSNVRETHIYLEGQTVELDDEFFTLDGDHALYPGGFTKAENNVNCRCVVKLQKQ